MEPTSLAEAVEAVRAERLDPASLELKALVVGALLGIDDPEVLGGALVAASWLLVRWLGALSAEPDDGVFELADERRERVLVALALQRAISRAGEQLARRFRDADVVLARAVPVPEPPLAPIDPASLRAALVGLEGRGRTAVGAVTVPGQMVRIEVVAERVLRAVRARRRTAFRDVVAGWRALEVVVGFVVVLEGYALGALTLEVIGDELWVGLVDDHAARALVGTLVESHD